MPYVAAQVVGFAVAAIGLPYGANAGYAINPARDLGPRVFAWATGWGELASPGTRPGSFNDCFWVPLGAPLLGGVIAILVYDLLIGDVLDLRTQVAPGDRLHPPGDQCPHGGDRRFTALGESPASPGPPQGRAGRAPSRGTRPSPAHADAAACVARP